MVTSINGAPASSGPSAISLPKATPTVSTASFTKQLAEALEGYLNQAQGGSHLEIDIESAQSQNSNVRQFIVTVKNPGTAESEKATPAAKGTPAPTPKASVSAAPASPTAPDTTPSDPLQAARDAYWAAQPPEVQQLRKVADFAARTQLAQELADKGYVIDRAIMVWGWDPLKTMSTRRMYGYTWVPNMNQASVSPPPAFHLDGQTPYDPNNPPPGSIRVDTSFADGLGITDPWAV